MKKSIVFFLALLAALSVNAQVEIYSLDQERATTVDTARYKVAYSLDYTWSPEIENRFNDTRSVLIGRCYVKDFSDVINHYDSLKTADIRRGADAYFNPKGMPWPYEVLISTKDRSSDMKYRLPVGMGVLHFPDSIGSMRWKFVPDSSLTILGYDCRQARCSYAGRQYTAWFAVDLPLPYGPYKFGGLPGLIMQMQDDEGQFVWKAIGFEKSHEPIVVYDYEGQKNCTAADAVKTVARIFKAPLATHLASIGGGKGRVFIVGADGKTRDATEVEDTPIPFRPIEIR